MIVSTAVTVTGLASVRAYRTSAIRNTNVKNAPSAQSQR